MKLIGIILIILGSAGILRYGIEAWNDSESFSFLGAEILVSKADWTPVIISASIFIIGLVLLMTKTKTGKKRRRR